MGEKMINALKNVFVASDKAAAIKEFIEFYFTELFAFINEKLGL